MQSVSTNGDAAGRCIQPCAGQPTHAADTTSSDKIKIWMKKCCRMD